MELDDWNNLFRGFRISLIKAGYPEDTLTLKGGYVMFVTPIFNTCFPFTKSNLQEIRGWRDFLLGLEQQ